MKLEEIKVCPTCSSPNLKYEPNYTYETIHYNDVEEKEVVGEVLLCSECFGIVFIEDGRLCRQFVPKREVFEFVAQVNDDRIYLIKDKV